MFSAFITTFFVLYFLIQLFLIFFILKPEKPSPTIKKEKVPFVSILVAARNEEKNILNCLKSLSNQDCPSDRFEILIGSDRSTDKTLEILKSYSKPSITVRIFDITTDLGRAKGKSNVLAQLCHHAKGEILLFTDADITVPPTWVSGMLDSFLENDKVVMNSAPTYIKGVGFMQKMQGLEWIFSLGIFKASAIAGIPISSVGNNMGLRKENYFKTGGYENFNFNIVEDYQLFNEVMKQGGKFQMLFNKKTLNISAPILSVKELLNQRNRWMQGALGCPWYHKIIMGLPFLFPYFAMVMAFINIKTALYCFLIKVILEWSYLTLLIKKLEIKPGFLPLIIYPFYYLIMLQLMVVSSFLNGGVVWKDRVYRGIIFGSRKQ